MNESDTEQHTGNEHPIPFIPAGAELTRQVLQEQERRFNDVLGEIMSAAEKHGATMRVIGSLAFRIQCPDFKHLEYDNERYLTDVDFIAYGKEIDKVQDAFFSLDWTENQSVLRLFGDKRRIFYHPGEPIHSDVFIDKLRFCHEIDFRGRLDIDETTISLVDLLLEKLQIVEINRKDLVDMMMLLRQHEISRDGSDQHRIDGAYLASLCASDWGLWRTATMNLRKSAKLAEEYLEPEDATVVTERLATLRRLIDEKPKSVKWRMRSKIGDRVKWYREVEEVDRD
ncbi:MAG: hypothetical protein GF400_08420 [Candidatus Eisenbacteria bacterium]|nr:hypothetical protein [Candidatus Eisenbacteria bacterium]